jgi:Ca2+-binding RTX toxin-like protein
MANYLGTVEDDTHIGTASSDQIEGFGGDDWLKDGPLSASSVADQIFGGYGDDIISVAGGADTIDGGGNQDRLIIDYGLSSAGFVLTTDDVIGNSLSSSNGLSVTSIETFEFRLGSGDDTVSAGAGDDLFNGNGGNDILFCKAGSDFAIGGIGEDQIYGGSGRDSLYGEADDDLLRGDSGDDSLFGGTGNDELHGGSGDDYLPGDAGADRLHGDSGIDTASYFGSAGGVTVDLAANLGDGGDAEGDTYSSIERLYGSVFDDTLTGSGQSDTLYGDDGNDVLRGGAGADVLQGSDGIDTASYYAGSVGVVISLQIGFGNGGDAQGDVLTGIENLSGSQGHDSLVGNSGTNMLQGWNGSDALTGGGGKDTLTGGAGGDRFLYAAIGDSLVGANADRITDFSHAQGDKIDLSAIDASTAVTGNQTFSFIGTGLYTGVAGQLRYAAAGGVTTIAGDVDGNGTSDFHIQLTRAIALVAGDFVL